MIQHSIIHQEYDMKIPLSKLAYARSGDKGDGSNVGVVAYTPAAYEIIKRVLIYIILESWIVWI